MYHITKTGEFAVCSATVKDCPLGGPHGTRQELEVALAEAHDLAGLSKAQRYPLPPSEGYPKNWGKDDLDFWKPIEESLGLYIFQGNGYIPGDPTMSTFYCFDCHRRLPKSDAYEKANWKVMCDCGHYAQDGLTGVTLKPGAEKYFNKQAVRDDEWYHYTSHEAWESFLNEDNDEARVVHLGTKEAALDRQNHTDRAVGKLYKVRLKPEAEIADEVLEDDPYNQEDAPLVREGGIQKGILVSGVTRYMNYYEDPGSVSLVANPRLLEIVEVQDYDEKSS